jgi:gamma-D-glutamyl-L-lysine dipeptidyl-peptidase
MNMLMTYSVGMSVADVWQEPTDGSERITQALLNTAVTYIEEVNGWARVKLPDYEGWMRMEDLAEMPVKGYTRLSQCCGTPLDLVVVVKALSAPFYSDAVGGEWVGEVYLSTVLPLADMTQPGRLELALPDRDSAWIERRDVRVRRAVEHPHESLQAITGYARAMLDVPYLWGGVTPQGLDCSAFVQLCYRMGGYTLPRDAWQQHTALSQSLKREEMREGDLIFFGREHITHVGMALNEHEYIHAEGQRYGRVVINSLAQDEPGYDERLAEIVRDVKRVIS